MGGSTTQTNTTTIPGASGQEASARALMEQISAKGAKELGNMSDLANGNLTLTPQNEALIRRINELTMQQAREAAKQNYSDIAGQVEANALDRGIEGSSMEQVNRAIGGRQLQSALDQQALQGQVTSAQQMQEMAVQGASTKLNANQLLLNSILGNSSALGQMGLNERLAQTTTTQTTKQGFNPTAMIGMGLQGLGMFMNPVGAAAGAAGAAAGGGGGSGGGAGGGSNAPGTLRQQS